MTKRELYTRYGVPYYWIFDPDARTLEVYELSEGTDRLVSTARGADAVSPPPFSDLALVPDSLWPSAS